MANSSRNDSITFKGQVMLLPASHAIDDFVTFKHECLNYAITYKARMD